MEDMPKLLTIKQASEWATDFLKKNVTPSNISYLIQYGKVKKIGNNGGTYISQTDLKKYYESFIGKREINWKEKLGKDLDWHLSFDHLKEADTTKHVHRLHPYKGKFIPQLVEYFLDDHVDEFKREVYFKKNDIILDPFCGSGTTLVQANELGMHAVGIDVSSFNALISNIKIEKHDFAELHHEIKKISVTLKQFIADSNTIKFEAKLLEKLAEFNDEYFPSPDFKHWIREGEVNEDVYGREKEKIFQPIFKKLVRDYDIEIKQSKSDSFLDKWYLKHVRSEIDFVFGIIDKIKDQDTKKVVSVILSRTIRSCRATTHADLATLIEPVTTTYYCSKHGKICKPLFSILTWWERYSLDTLKRLSDFEKLKTKTYQLCLTEDSRTVDIIASVRKENKAFASLIKGKKIKGIFSSPPYVGLIDYHEQHAYAYDLFGFKRKDDAEIGRLYHGSGLEARESYVKGISDVLNNCKKYLVEDYSVFLVANDKFNLYPIIAEKCGMKIIQQFKRPVLNRTERDKSAYSEIIFQLKGR